MGLSGVTRRLVPGAPIAYKTTNISVRVLFAGNDSLQNVLVADNTDSLVIDFDGIDDGTDLALSGFGIAVVELFGHQSCKGVDFDRVDHRHRSALSAGPIIGGLGSLALGFSGMPCVLAGHRRV